MCFNLPNTIEITFHTFQTTQDEVNVYRHFDIPVYCHPVLEGNGPITPMRMAKQLYREPHTVTEKLQRMEKIGLVSLAHDLDKKIWFTLD